MLVNVCYRVPVVCVVDTKTKRVVRVVVDDESIGQVQSYETAERSLDRHSREALAAHRIAEGAEWPGWEFGF